MKWHCAPWGAVAWKGLASLTERVSRGLELDTTPAAKKRADDYDAINGLMRAGLVFAGANQHSKTNDGILPANEAAWLDLTGTELVVLSACETGVGRVNSGDGLQGMQRALLWAGARSLVMSLWKVDDEGTRDLMVGFYEGLKRKQPRAGALRDAQLRMLTSATHRHPYYWAAFVQYGDASPLE